MASPQPEKRGPSSVDKHHSRKVSAGMFKATVKADHFK